MCDYLDCCDDEHSSLQEKFLHALFKQYGFTAQSLPVLVHGVQSMQELKPAKEFRTLIANEESLNALLEIKEHLEDYLPEESGGTERHCPICGRMSSGPSGERIPGTAAARLSRQLQTN